MVCPDCGRHAEGAFCPDCGAPKAGAACGSCREPLPPDARFCPSCGTATRASPPRLPWLVAGGALAALIVVLLIAVLRPGPAGGARRFDMQPDAGMGAGFQAGAAPALTGSIRDQADRLFNRIMQARSEGDVEQAMFFLPMALTAYRESAPLDNDGLYHLGMLEILAGDHDAARATAGRILADEPTHLLALAVVAEAAGAAGDTAAAADAYRRLLAAFDAEHARQLPEYRDHARVLPEYRDAAQSFLQQQ